MDIDLNADLGESFGRWTLGDDEALLQVVTSANVACGFHAGDPATLVRTCAAAAAHGVRIGAQVGYRDLAGFGRRFIDVAPDDLYADVLYQIGALDGIARSVGSQVSYVKPHGALYNTVVHNPHQAEAVVRAVRDFGGSLPVLGLPETVFFVAAEQAGLPAVAEAFVDRAYTSEATLVPRSRDGAVLSEPVAIAARAVRMVRDHAVMSWDGEVVDIHAKSLCVHGDSPGSVAIAQAVRGALAAADIGLAPFVP